MNNADHLNKSPKVSFQLIKNQKKHHLHSAGEPDSCSGLTGSMSCVRP